MGKKNLKFLLNSKKMTFLPYHLFFTQNSAFGATWTWIFQTMIPGDTCHRIMCLRDHVTRNLILYLFHALIFYFGGVFLLIEQPKLRI